MLRRTLAVMGTSAVVAVAAIAPANAEAPKLQSYAAGASGTAFELTLLGQQLSFSNTTAGVSSTGPTAVADGAAALLAGTAAPGNAPAKTPDGAATNSSCDLAADLETLTEGQLDLLGIEIGCVNTATTVNNGEPSASSTADALMITIDSPGGEALEQILTPIFEGLATVTGPLFDGLDAITDPLHEATGIDVPAVVDSVVADLQEDDFVLAQITIAPSASEAYASATDGVVARAGSNGVTVSLFPGIARTIAELAGLTGDELPAIAPLLEIAIGKATAEVVRDPITGEIKPDASAVQLLTIEQDDSLGILEQITGPLTQQINDFALTQLACTGENPIADVLCVEAGTIRDLSAAELTARGYDFGPGTVGREAAASRIEVLGVLAEQLGGAALGIEFAAADAAANAVPLAAAPPAQDPLPAPAGPPLPRTGADSTLPLTLGLLGVGAAGAMLLRRTRTSS